MWWRREASGGSAGADRLGSQASQTPAAKIAGNCRRDLRNIRWRALANRAETLVRLGRYSEALADYDELITIQQEAPHVDPEDSPQLLGLFQALTKARLGDLSALTRLGEQVRDYSQGQGRLSSRLLDHLLRCGLRPRGTGTTALQHQTKQLTERQPLAQQDLDRTLALLDQARSTGEFKGMIRLDEIRREPTLDVLRSNRRFQLLMMDLAFPDNPFGGEKSP